MLLKVNFMQDMDAEALRGIAKVCRHFCMMSHASICLFIQETHGLPIVLAYFQSVAHFMFIELCMVYVLKHNKDCIGVSRAWSFAATSPDKQPLCKGKLATNFSSSSPAL
jgi:hypothetical protein